MENIFSSVPSTEREVFQENSMTRTDRQLVMARENLGEAKRTLEELKPETEKSQEADQLSKLLLKKTQQDLDDFKKVLLAPGNYSQLQKDILNIQLKNAELKFEIKELTQEAMIATLKAKPRAKPTVQPTENHEASISNENAVNQQKEKELVLLWDQTRKIQFNCNELKMKKTISDNASKHRTSELEKIRMEKHVLTVWMVEMEDPNKQDKESLQTKKAQLEQEAEELENEFQSLKTQKSARLAASRVYLPPSSSHDGSSEQTRRIVEAVIRIGKRRRDLGLPERSKCGDETESD